MTSAPAERPASYFPKAECLFKGSNQLHPTLPPRPVKVEPVFDDEHANVPLPPFDDVAHRIHYADPSPPRSTPPPPPLPASSSSRYLVPTLTRNERLRLTMLWYYTRGIAEDKVLLQKLQDIVNLVRGFMGFEFVIMGILSEDTYTRLVTNGLPLAIMPRRESTCAHTINQERGVFVLPNMLADWRFRHSPHVEEGGLRSYAGAQLRCETQKGQYIALGTLCVAANSETVYPSPEKQAALAQFADILSAEIVNKSRIGRQRQRQVMGDLVSSVKSLANQDNVEDLVRGALGQIYPDANISIQDSDDNMIRLENRLPIPFSAIRDGLWEDSEFVEMLILTRNYQRLTSTQTVRAIVTRCRKQPHARYLVVASKEVQLVFDDIDAWFVEACSLILFDFYQELILTEALQAKEIFLRGITHQLRTPIHGILGSVELLGEELSSRNLLQVVDGPNGQNSFNHLHLLKNARLYLSAIQNSGRELMSTVNNMLMLNRWAESSRSMKPASLYELNQLEADILRDISQMLPEDELASTSILFDNRLTVDCSIITIDIALLKEGLQSLILNAVQSTTNGSVLVVTSAKNDYSVLQFDVIDTGHGISKADQQRIFEAYEKADPHTRGVGLGLTIASKIASAMNGSLYLVSSELGKGSHFRAEFRNPGFACPNHRGPTSPARLADLPRLFHEVPTGNEATPLVRHFMEFLEHRGYSRSPYSQGSLNIVGFVEDKEQFKDHFDQVDPNAVSICLVPSRASSAKPQHMPSSNANVLFFEGPFFSARLNDILKEVDEKCASLRLQSSTDSIPSCPLGTNEQLHEIFAIKIRSPAPITALLVDDNAINLRIFRMYCEKRRIPYALASEGNEAVAKYKAHLQTQPFNLILMDLQMPNCDGIEATKRIRAIERRVGRHPSVVFIITGQDSPEDKSSSKDAGADEFFVKPMSIKALDHGISQYFDQRGG